MTLEWRYLFEIGNGLWSIVLVHLVVFLAYHLVKVGFQRRLRVSGWLSLPLSMQLAVGVWVASLGLLITRFVIWISRYTNHGTLSPGEGDGTAFFFGTVIGLVGFMCILRVATKPMLGHAPWVSAMFWSAVYLAWTMVRLRHA